MLSVLYWDYDGDSSAYIGCSSGGNDTWNPSDATPRWRLDGPTGTLTTWISGSTPVFSGRSGSVNLSEATSVEGITFETGGYALSGASLSNAAAANPIQVSAGSASLGNVISGDGEMTKTGDGILTLSARNTYTGDTIVSAGTLQLLRTDWSTNDGVLAPGTQLIIDGAATTVRALNHSPLGNDGNYAPAVTFKHGGTLTINDNFSAALNAITFDAGGGTLTSGANPDPTHGSWRLEGTSAIRTLTGAGTPIISAVRPKIAYKTFETAEGTMLSITGNMTGTTLTKTGAGMLTLSGGNNYQGGTTINQGNLCVLGGINAVNVNDGGILSGVGLMSSVNVYSGGSVKPGNNGGEGIGTLHILNITFSAGSHFYAQLAEGSPAADALDVSGAVSLGGAALHLSGNRQYHDVALALILNGWEDPISGTFAGLDEGDEVEVNGVTYQVAYAYNANDMALLPQP
jgi:fibronectin-binding autotransporter adhesin